MTRTPTARIDDAAFDQRQAMEDARTEWEQHEAIRETCELASGYLNAFMVDLTKASPLLREMRQAELAREFAAYKGTIELMTGETWPAMLPAFLAACDARSNRDEMTDRELAELVA